MKWILSKSLLKKKWFHFYTNRQSLNIINLEHYLGFHENLVVLVKLKM